MFLVRSPNKDHDGVARIEHGSPVQGDRMSQLNGSVGYAALCRHYTYIQYHYSHPYVVRTRIFLPEIGSFSFETPFSLFSFL